jgi:Protein of unknown function (DUF2905)
VGLESIGKVLLGVGLAIIVLGGLLILFGKLGWTHLPGTFIYRGKNATVIIPIGLMILLSVIVSLVLHFMNRR